MDSRRKTRQSADHEPVVVTAPSLKEAYRRIKQEYGEDAVILDSKTINRRQSVGLGNEKVVQVTVSPPGQTFSLNPQNQVPGSISAQTASGTTLPADVEKEVERIESLVTAIQEEYKDQRGRERILTDSPVGSCLVDAGTQAETVEKLLTRFTSATGHSVSERVAAINWLTENTRASNCEWDGFYGCHAFLGKAGSGRSEMVFAAAAKLQELGRKTLVLSVMPDHNGHVRRLQTAASEMGFDAAVIQTRQQLARTENHLTKYEAVLVDLPSFGNPEMAVGGSIHRWLAGNTGFHRHLILPLDSDPQDATDLQPTARDWQVDWIAMSRCDLSSRPGKFLDFAEVFPVPFSLVGEKRENACQLHIASSGDILDRVLGTSTVLSESGEA